MPVTSAANLTCQQKDLLRGIFLLTKISDIIIYEWTWAGDVTSNISPLTSELRGASPRRSTQKIPQASRLGDFCIFYITYYLLLISFNFLPATAPRHRHRESAPGQCPLNPDPW